MNLKYFRLSEFDSPDDPGSRQRMDPQFLKMLDRAREISGVPYKVTSGVRTKEHNKAVGGVPRSSHLVGLAADISARDNVTRAHILRGLIKVGFNRIGIHRYFIHVDDDQTKAPDVCWLY